MSTARLEMSDPLDLLRRRLDPEFPGHPEFQSDRSILGCPEFPHTPVRLEVLQMDCNTKQELKVPLFLDLFLTPLVTIHSIQLR